MQAPTITLEGKEYTARKLKMKAWRQVVKLQKDLAGLDATTALQDEEIMGKMAGALEAFFNHPEVTAEKIMEDMDLADFVPAIRAVSVWVTDQVNGKVEQFPKNSQTTVEG